jgi:hypothetical protein
LDVLMKDFYLKLDKLGRLCSNTIQLKKLGITNLPRHFNLVMGVFIRRKYPTDSVVVAWATRESGSLLPGSLLGNKGYLKPVDSCICWRDIESNAALLLCIFTVC